MHTFPGQDRISCESVHTSFSLCAHCPSAYRVPGPARRSIRLTCMDKIMWIVLYLFLASGPAARRTECGGRTPAGRAGAERAATSEARSSGEETTPLSA